MIAFPSVLALLLISPTWASPLPTQSLRFPHFDPNDILCQLPLVKHILCPRQGVLPLNIKTVLGTALGTLDPAGAHRFIVKYASADRWAPSTIAQTWNLPTGSANESTLPLACPQLEADPSTYTEDCLSMILYVPPSLTPTSAAPTLVWIHGGSFVVGSATGPGLDGSNLAISTESIVAVIQYRLGALGLLSPDGKTNLAVEDVMNALQFLKKVVPAFGGSASEITLAGQSSGAGMIRALLATPSASSLFKSAILQSDPMNYGFLSPATQNLLQNNFNQLINCGPADTSCQKSLSLDAILSAQDTLSRKSMSIDPSVGSAEPIRPVQDGSLIKSPLDSTAPFPSVNKPLLLSTVLDEAGAAIYGQFHDPLPQDAFGSVCDATLGPNRTSQIVSSSRYPLASFAADIRPQLEVLATDYIWKCSTWSFARQWVQNGGRAYVGLYTVGASYPGNDAYPFCTEPGSICHQDDIEIVFGTVSNPTPAQSALTAEMQKRYKAFLSNGNPNAPGTPSWTAATSTNVHALQLGSPGEAPVGACDPSFWGQSIQYDYQFYNI